VTDRDLVARLELVVAIPGVRAALIAAVDDGLVVHEAVMGDLAAEDVAALVAAFIRRGTELAIGVTSGPPNLVQLMATNGIVVAAAGSEPLWLIAVASPDTELGRLRLLVGDLAGQLN
jgi:predicted regulator of Ras-like GTPase activity (Roadblock/LC7/MglB family)